MPRLISTPNIVQAGEYVAGCLPAFSPATIRRVG
jgi:hypothetical protein